MALRLPSIYLVLLPITLVLGNRQGNYTSISDAIWQLGGLLAYTPSPFLNNGGQNFTHCCLLAVNSSLVFNHGYINESETYFIDTDVDSLIATSENGQFPCTAEYNGDDKGAPVVAVPYTWMTGECPGWELSEGNNPWIQQLAGFLLPALVFCLTIPRRYKIKVPDFLFEADILQGVSWLLAPLAMIPAGILVTADILLWLAVCFVWAGPMLLSAVYEAFLDYRVLKFLEDARRFKAMTTKMRARLLFVTLVGNLDLETEYNSETISHSTTLIDDPLSGSPWDHIEGLLQGLPDDDRLAPNQVRSEIDLVITQTKTRLRTMLECQYSFGSTVGAPVIFFLGGFIFALMGSRSELGDVNTSLSLCFGMWYMIIPHISIVSGLLLAGNNPNTLAGIVSHSVKEYEEPVGYNLFEPAYKSCFKVASLWARGQNKAKWLRRVCDNRMDSEELIITELKREIEFSFATWFSVTFVALGLQAAPFLLAFLTAFYTPEIGVSCWTFTFLVNFSAQLSLGFLWFWALICYRSVRRGRSRFVWWLIAFLSGTAGIVSVIGGTLMSLMGVYSADVCNITAMYWGIPSREASAPPIVVSQNTPLDIKEAKEWWINCGIVGVAFMAAVAFVGWWYQRRLRNKFEWLVKNISGLQETGMTAVSNNGSLCRIETEED